MQPEHSKTIISVHSPELRPQFINIGYGNPRYNSLLVSDDDTVIIPCGSTLRKVDIEKNEVLINTQIGHSQIFQILGNKEFVMVVNFDGIMSLIDWNNFEILKQIQVGGKEIRHSSITEYYIAVSCELNNKSKMCLLELYSIEEIKKQSSSTIKPFITKEGWFYFPEIIDNYLYFIEFNDPNPKGRSRTETVLNNKLPITHRILRININDPNQSIEEVYQIKAEGDILCAAFNQKSRQLFYLHQAKKLTILNVDTQKCEELVLTATGAPYCIETDNEGILFASKSNELTYLEFKEKTHFKTIELKIKGLCSNYAIKRTKKNPENFIFFNENGLEHHNPKTTRTFSQNLFGITNCGLSFNQNASAFAIADFEGNIHILSSEENQPVPQPLTRISIGIPVRSLAWCHDTNNIIIGCVGGYLFCWDGCSEEATLICQTNNHTVNIVRYFQNYIIFGTSDGFVHIMCSMTLQEIYKFQAHFPIHYENEVDRELFGSMKNYAEIWSIIAYQLNKPGAFHLVTCSEDQTEKVFLVTINPDQTLSHKQEHHLVGHSLAVTSIDCKSMEKGIGEIYVSCSDDKIVRFRSPSNMFKILHELETSTIKEWHTLTYLALEPNGHRVAIGSQNGYLFIFDILEKKLVYGEKIHLGGIEGMDWVNGRLVTCSSDLCISIIRL